MFKYSIVQESKNAKIKNLYNYSSMFVQYVFFNICTMKPLILILESDICTRQSENNFYKMF